MKRVLVAFYALLCGNQNFSVEPDERTPEKITVQVTGNNLSSNSSTVKLQGSNDFVNWFDMKDSQGNPLQTTVNSSNNIVSMSACNPYKYVRACLTAGDTAGSINIDMYSK